MRAPGRVDLPANGNLPSRQREPGPSYPLSSIGNTGGVDDGIVARRVETRWSRRKQERQAGLFLKGPIPLELLRRAAVLSGWALDLYILIRHRSDMCYGQAVTLPTDLLTGWGIGKNAKAHALAALETAELITVDRQVGHTAVVSVVDGADQGRLGG